jgi:hypothetical protein
MKRMDCMNLAAAIVMGAFLLTAGCEKAGSPPAPSPKVEHKDDHGHEHDHGSLTNLNDAMKELDELYTTIKSVGETGDIKQAHDPLHELSHVLEEIPGLADKDEKLNENQRAAVRKAINALFDAYGVVDAKLHGDGGKDYKEVSTDIDKGMADLKAAIAAPVKVDAPVKTDAPKMDIPATPPEMKKEEVKPTETPKEAPKSTEPEKPVTPTTPEPPVTPESPEKK